MNGYSSNSRPSTDKILIIASFNQGKVREIRDAFEDLNLNLRTLSDFPDMIEAPETGTTFTENARQKAEFYGARLGVYAVLAEDSGLVIPFLDGYPGIHSARIAGDDPSRIQLVLQRLSEKGAADRSSRRAFYACAMCLLSGSTMRIVEARCDGIITQAPAGMLGFGYDPIFLPEGAEKTFGQMTIREKSRFSHRGRAAREMRPYILQEFIRS